MSEQLRIHTIDKAINYARSISRKKSDLPSVYAALRRQGFSAAIAKEALEVVNEDDKFQADILTNKMREAFDLAFDLHIEGKDFQSILSALRENSSLDFDERIEIMDLLEAEGNAVTVSNQFAWSTVPFLFTVGIIFIAVSFWVMQNELEWNGGYVYVISWTKIRVVWLPLGFGVILVIWSMVDLYKFYRTRAKRKAQQDRG